MHSIIQLIVQVSKTLQLQDIYLCQAIEEVKSLALASEELRIEEKI